MAKLISSPIYVTINEEVKDKAKSQLEKWMGNYDEQDVEEVDAQL